MRLQSPARLVAGLALLLNAGSAAGQGNFQNLDFEAANIPQGHAPGIVNATDALPGWTVYFGTNQSSQVRYNDPAAGSTSVTLLATANGPGTYDTIEGTFTVLLQGGVIQVPGDGFVPAAASISQTGLVPTSAKSIQFKTHPDLGAFLLSLGGQNIPLLALSSTANYTLFGGDISASAGQTRELSFSALRNPSSGLNDWGLDSIRFSDQPIPEPGVFGLSALGALLLGWRALRQRR